LNIKEKEQLVQIHDTMSQKTESMTIDEKIYLIFPGSMGIIFVGKNKFFRITYDTFGNKEKLTEIASSTTL
jgi:hypothetical protein